LKTFAQIEPQRKCPFYQACRSKADVQLSTHLRSFGYEIIWRPEWRLSGMKAGPVNAEKKWEWKNTPTSHSFRHARSGVDQLVFDQAVKPVVVTGPKLVDRSLPIVFQH